jgi:Holliday junction DNA helicase RuvB
MSERELSAESSPKEYEYDVRLRPQNFDEYIGQTKIVKNIEMMVNSSQMRGSAMDHVLLSGPPGLGKTSLGMLIAKSLGSQMHMISGPSIEKKGDLAAVLTNLNPKDVLFIDEIHRMPISIEEILYSAVEDFRLDIIIGQGASARTMQIDIAPFTLIGATTRSGLLSNPLRDRFMATFHFDYYEIADLAKIISNNAKKISLGLSAEALTEIAKRSRGTPRIANRILRRVRDFVIVKSQTKAQLDDVLAAMELLDIDYLGLDNMDRKNFKGDERLL